MGVVCGEHTLTLTLALPLTRRGLRLITLTAQCYETRYADLAPTFKKVSWWRK